MNLKELQRANALLADGTLLPGNALHRATLAGKPGHKAVFKPCCAKGSPTIECRCPTEKRIETVLKWVPLTKKVQRMFPPRHPFRITI